MILILLRNAKKYLLSKVQDQLKVVILINTNTEEDEKKEEHANLHRSQAIQMYIWRNIKAFNTSKGISVGLYEAIDR